jgi:hypothetical protein
MEGAMGCYLARPTGKVLAEGDTTLIEISLNGKITYAAVSMPFGMYFVPSENYLQKYVRDCLAWVMFEHGDDSYPVVIGFRPFRNRTPTNYPNVFVFKTEKYKITIDDKEETVVTEFLDGTKTEVSKDSYRISHEGGRVIELSKDMVSLGSAGKSAEPAVLGDKNEEVLRELVAELDSLRGNFQKVYQALKVMGIVIPSVDLQLPLLMQDIAKTKNRIPGTKSKKTTLD